MHKLHSRLFTDTRHSGYVVGAVAHERFKVNNFGGREAVLLKKDFGVILLRFGFSHTGFVMNDMTFVCDELEAVLVSRYDAAVPTRPFADPAHGADYIIRLESLKLKARHAHCVKDLLHHRHLHRKLIRHSLSLRLVLRVLQMPEGRGLEVKCNTDRIGLFRFKQLAEDRKKAVNSVCRSSVRGVEHTDAVIRTVYYAVAVKYHQLHFIFLPGV